MRKIFWTIGIIVLVFVIGFVYFSAEYYSAVATGKIVEKAVDLPQIQAPNETYPLVLLHGYNPSYSPSLSQQPMKELAKHLEADLKYQDKGIFTEATSCAQLVYAQRPIVIRASYFEGDSFSEIPEHAEKLAEVIDKIKDCTGAKQVDIVAHSMGGVVSRDYIQEHEGNVRKLVMLGTPNKGGLYNLGSVASSSFVSKKLSPQTDFVSLTKDHPFLQELNSKQEKEDQVKMYTIAGEIDARGDGLVEINAVQLKHAQQNWIVGCDHFALRDPLRCLNSYEHIKDALQS